MSEKDKVYDIVYVKFTAYDKPDQEEFFLSKSVKQAEHTIFHDICNTATIDKIRGMMLQSDEEITVFRKKMSDK